LKDLKQVLELCDEEGKVVGRFYPVRESSKWIPWVPEISTEELERRRNGEWLTTEQAIAYLEKLGCFR
jgi:hypothetical protein